ncbi:MAG: hypothetical protein OMM_11822, partial [Candidatus Magnetoglobus multicellularis str. Araruama]
GGTDTFNLNVIVSETEVANGLEDTITVSVTSQGNRSLTHAFQVVTTIPAFSFETQALTNHVLITCGASYYFPIKIHNTGATTDTYNLSINSGSWSYTIRNQLDTASISTMSVGSGITDLFYVKVKVPQMNVSNNQSDQVVLNVSSQGNRSVQSNPIVLTSTTPLIVSNMQAVKNQAIVYPGQSYLYPIHISNKGILKDSYYLSVSSGTFSYTIRNQFDNASIREISVAPGITETFLVNVDVPYSGITNGAIDSVTIESISQNNSSVSQSIAITTTTPSFGFGMAKATQDTTVYPGQSFNYQVIISNSSTYTDTFDLSTTSGSWGYQIRDVSDTENISTISVGAGLSETFLVKVSVPYTGVSNGASDSVNIVAVSQGNNQLSQNVQATTTTPTVSFTAQNVSGDSVIGTNQSYNYLLQIQNTGTAMDTYDISVIGGNWSYTIRNAGDNGTISHITVHAGDVATFLVKVTTPPVASNAETDSITISTISQGNPSVQNHITATTSIPVFSHKVVTQTNSSTVNIGQYFSYQFDISNTASTNDTYNINRLGGNFLYSIRNSLDTADITTLSVNSGQTQTFIVKVTLPITVTHGASESITIQTISQGNAGIITNTALATTASRYSFTMQRLTNNATIYPGQSLDYLVQINNTEIPNDTYNLTCQGGALFTYTLRNAANTMDITSISINAGLSGTFLVKVTVPLENIPNGAAESITLNVVSQGKSTVLDSDLITTTTPA